MAGQLSCNCQLRWMCGLLACRDQAAETYALDPDMAAKLR